MWVEDDIAIDDPDEEDNGSRRWSFEPTSLAVSIWEALHIIHFRQQHTFHSEWNGLTTIFEPNGIALRKKVIERKTLKYDDDHHNAVTNNLIYAAFCVYKSEQSEESDMMPYRVGVWSVRIFVTANDIHCKDEEDEKVAV